MRRHTDIGDIEDVLDVSNTQLDRKLTSDNDVSSKFEQRNIQII